ncbi:MAG TPA: ParA family protein [Chthonomonadaceae bacterium]|nr:ParA family protein [Chthonomonadaceae bacterium]
MLTYAISSQKGGVGKTTTTVNLGAALAQQGKRVLLLDMDPQGSLTAAVGATTDGISMGDVLEHPEHTINAIAQCTGGMRVIAASPTLASVFQVLAEMSTPAFRLSMALRSVADCFDYALIDCPPALGHATANALTASDVVLVPLQCEFLSMRGLHDMKDITAIIQDTTNRGLKLRVLGTMFDKRTLHANAVLQEANRDLPGLVYQTVIPRTIRLAEAPAAGKTIFEYAPESNGAYAYSMLAQEILQEVTDYGTTAGNTAGTQFLPSNSRAA